MTREDKDLLLKDLCSRLPYGVKIQYHHIQETITDILLDINMFGRVNIYGHIKDICDVKPYLFPLSSMTEEQLYELKEMFGFEIEFRDGLIEVSTFHHNSLGYLEMDAMFEWFNRNHFDWRGLIPMGLAIDATELNIY